MATTSDVLHRIDQMWVTHGETHQLLGILADRDPDLVATALDCLDRIRATMPAKTMEVTG